MRIILDTTRTLVTGQMNGAGFWAMEEAQRKERAGDVYKKVAASGLQLAAICLWATKKMILRFYQMTLNAHNKNSRTEGTRVFPKIIE